MKSSFNQSTHEIYQHKICLHITYVLLVGIQNIVAGVVNNKVEEDVVLAD